MCHPSWGRARAEAQHLSDLARLRRVRDRIDREYARPLDVLALAREAGMAPGHLGRRFRLAYGHSPYAYLTARRVERAAAPPVHGGPGVTEAGSAAGCPSPAAFGARSTGPAGVPPGAHRSAHRVPALPLAAPSRPRGARGARPPARRPPVRPAAAAPPPPPADVRNMAGKT